MLPWLTEQDMLEKAKIGKKIKGVAPSCTLNIHVTVDSHSYFDRVKPMVLVLPTSPDHTHHWTWVALQAHPSCTKTTLSTSMSKCWLWWKKTHLQTKYQIIRAILVPIFSWIKDYIGFSLFSLFNFCSQIFDFFKKKFLFWGLFWGLIAKTPCSQCRGTASHPCLGD